MCACVNVKLREILVQFRKTVYTIVEDQFSNKGLLLLLLLLLCFVFFICEMMEFKAGYIYSVMYRHVWKNELDILQY
jgi:hypothetical protein